MVKKQGTWNPVILRPKFKLSIKKVSRNHGSKPIQRLLTFNKNNGKYKNWRTPKVEIFEFCFDPSILLIFLMKKHVLFEFLTLKWLNYMHFLFWPSESPSYNYVHLKFLIFIESTYFSHMMITRGGAVQFFKTVVTLAFARDAKSPRLKPRSNLWVWISLHKHTLY